MSQTTSFGRRQASAQPPGAYPPARRPEPVQAAGDLSPAAQAFLRADQQARQGEDEAFKAWRRAQTPGRVIAWMVSIALLMPGLICFALDLPMPIAAGVELAGIVIGWQLRRMRRQHLSKIASWQAEQV